MVFRDRASDGTTRLTGGFPEVVPGQVGSGTHAEMLATTPDYWQFWYDTDEDRIYVGNKSGGWRRYSGRANIPEAAWAVTQNPVFARTVSSTLPTVLEPNEYITASAITVGTGYGIVSGSGLSRNPTNTVYGMRFMQLGSSALNGFSIIWHITPGA